MSTRTRVPVRPPLPSKRPLSRRRPKGGPADWPVEDYNALVYLIRSADLLRPEEHIVDRVTEAAIDAGIDPRHWLVQEVLAGVYGKFPIYGGLYYAEDAEAFFRNAGREDLRERETLDWAMSLAAGRQH